MKIGIETHLIVMGGTSRDYKTSNGAAGTSYSLAVFQDGQCTNVNVTEDVFKEVTYDPTKYVAFSGTYDDKYGRFVLDKILYNDTPVAAPANSSVPDASAGSSTATKT